MNYGGSFGAIEAMSKQIRTMEKVTRMSSLATINNQYRNIHSSLGLGMIMSYYDTPWYKEMERVQKLVSLNIESMLPDIAQISRISEAMNTGLKLINQLPIEYANAALNSISVVRTFTFPAGEEEVLEGYETANEIIEEEVTETINALTEANKWDSIVVLDSALRLISDKWVLCFSGVLVGIQYKDTLYDLYQAINLLYVEEPFLVDTVKLLIEFVLIKYASTTKKVK